METINPTRVDMVNTVLHQQTPTVSYFSIISNGLSRHGSGITLDVWDDSLTQLCQSGENASLSYFLLKHPMFYSKGFLQGTSPKSLGNCNIPEQIT